MNSATVVMYDQPGSQKIFLTPSVGGMPFTNISETTTAVVYSPSGVELETITIATIASSDTADPSLSITSTFPASLYPVGRDYYVLFTVVGTVDGRAETLVTRVGFDVVNFTVGCNVTPKQVYAMDADLRRVNTLNDEAEVRVYILIAYEALKQRLRSTERYEDLIIDGNLWDICLLYETLLRIYRYVGPQEKIDMYADAAAAAWSSFASNFRFANEDDPSEITTESVYGRRIR